MNIKPIAKAVIGAISIITVAITGYAMDNVIDAPEIAELASIAVEAALGVYAIWRVPNVEK